ncbi:MAG: type II toxin-antitoxin system PemK/MazF family toxin [Deltaproteobacteria bacterium]|nr:MAG: type II toxin-antitoxin system PemK/MazF family toxin [Deltaproteobacteria bacterium]
MKRGEIRWYRFARPDKRRPVVILTRDSILEYLGEVTIAPVTTTVRGIPSEVPVLRVEGFPRASAINLDHVQTVSRGKIEGLITTLTPSKMREIRAALLFALGF